MLVAFLSEWLLKPMEYVLLNYLFFLALNNSCMSFYRTSPAEFIVPFDQYMESVKNNYSIGMRFKMRFEGEEAPEQRYVFYYQFLK